ncbi:MAG: type II pantothenate kinase [Spirochaetota bacterium]|nr:type II pantothenate kinase [Spirochaetota bacterium]
MIVGIDIGGTTTDIVGLKDGSIINPISVKADDPITAAAGALGKLLDSLNLPLSNVKMIAATGVGSSFINSKLLDIPVTKVNEFTSIGTGGSFLTNIHKGIVVSMGTGTAIVQVDDNDISHWGGCGIGGGTLIGLSKKILNISNINILLEKASTGSLDKVDLTVQDIAGGPIDHLPGSLTASNFGKLSDDASDEDIALAIINLVCQTIGVLAISAARATGYINIILIGKLASIPYVKSIIIDVGDLLGMKFYIPEYADYATAIGAAITVDRNITT